VSAGDWHDRPLRYEVLGPGSECQVFSTMREAKQYRAIRRRSLSEKEAIHAYVVA
jgi:hypothetical protein